MKLNLFRGSIHRHQWIQLVSSLRNLMLERDRSKWMGWKYLCIRFQMFDRCKLMAWMSTFSFLSCRWCLPSPKSILLDKGDYTAIPMEGTAALTPWNFARCSKFTVVPGTIVHYDEMMRRLRFRIFWHDADTLSPFEHWHGKGDDVTYKEVTVTEFSDFPFEKWKCHSLRFAIVTILVLS